MEITPADATQVRELVEKEKGKKSKENIPPERSSPAQSASPTTDVDGREDVEIYDEGDHIVIENRDGDVIAVESVPGEWGEKDAEKLSKLEPGAAGPSGWGYGALKQRIVNWRDEEIEKRKEKETKGRKGEPARAYQFGTTVGAPELRPMIQMLTLRTDYCGKRGRRCREDVRAPVAETRGRYCQPRSQVHGHGRLGEIWREVEYASESNGGGRTRCCA
jgi:hypothetical protein